MIYARNHIFEAKTCSLDFERHGRFVLLNFEDAISKLIVRATEADMAAMAGNFIKQRLFGLH